MHNNLEQQTGRFLKQLRIAKGYTQLELARMLNVSDKAVSRWENGLGMPEISSIIQIAKIYGILVDDILNSNENVILQLRNDNGIKPNPENESNERINDERALSDIQSENNVFPPSFEAYYNHIVTKNQKPARTDNLPSRFYTILIVTMMTVGIYIFNLSRTHSTTQTSDGIGIVALMIIMTGIIFLGLVHLLDRFISRKESAILTLLACFFTIIGLGIFFFSCVYYEPISAPFQIICSVFILQLLMQILYKFSETTKNKVGKLTIHSICFMFSIISVIISIIYLVIAPPHILARQHGIKTIDILLNIASLPLFFAALSTFTYSVCVILENLLNKKIMRFVKITIPVFVLITIVSSIVLTSPGIGPLDSIYFYEPGIFFSGSGIYRLWMLCPLAWSVSLIFSNNLIKAAIELGGALIHIALIAPIVFYAYDGIMINLFLYTSNSFLIDSTNILLRLCFCFALVLTGVRNVTEFIIQTIKFCKEKKGEKTNNI